MSAVPERPAYRLLSNRRVTLRFAWYDLWVGAYYDRTHRVLYVCPLPCVLITLPRRQAKGEPFPPEWETALTDWQGSGDDLPRCDHDFYETMDRGGDPVWLCRNRCGHTRQVAP